jgi:hypothetical protein
MSGVGGTEGNISYQSKPLFGQTLSCAVLAEVGGLKVKLKSLERMSFVDQYSSRI